MSPSRCWAQSAIALQNKDAQCKQVRHAQKKNPREQASKQYPQIDAQKQVQVGNAITSNTNLSPNKRVIKDSDIAAKVSQKSSNNHTNMVSIYDQYY